MVVVFKTVDLMDQAVYLEVEVVEVWVGEPQDQQAVDPRPEVYLQVA